jgi:hypothetical protein
LPRPAPGRAEMADRNQVVVVSATDEKIVTSQG